MSRSGPGTLAWSEQTGGRLRRREKAQLIGMLMQAQLRDLAERQLIRSPAMQRVLARTSLDHVPLPDSPLIRQAEEYAQDVYGQPLRLHCYRTYMWGALLGQGQGLAYDAELLLVASLLHDLGLTPGQLSRAHTCCFAVTGARQARGFVEAHGWSAEQGETVYEAVSLHLNPVIDARVHGAEAHLLGAGAMLDVTGLKRHRIPGSVIDEVHARYPRTGFRDDILQTMTAPHRPDSRADFMNTGFQRAARNNPLDHGQAE